MFAKNRIKYYTYHVNTIFYQYYRLQRQKKYPRSRKGRRCQRQGNVDDVNSISNQHRRCRDIDNVDDV